MHVQLLCTALRRNTVHAAILFRCGSAYSNSRTLLTYLLEYSAAGPQVHPHSEHSWLLLYLPPVVAASILTLTNDTGCAGTVCDPTAPPGDVSTCAEACYTAKIMACIKCDSSGNAPEGSICTASGTCGGGGGGGGGGNDADCTLDIVRSSLYLFICMVT